MDIYELIGWVGALSFIAAYLLLVTDKISVEKPFYHILNAMGGICLTLNSPAGYAYCGGKRSLDRYCGLCYL